MLYIFSDGYVGRNTRTYLRCEDQSYTFGYGEIKSSSVILYRKQNRRHMACKFLIITLSWLMTLILYLVSSDRVQDDRQEFYVEYIGNLTECDAAE